MNSVSPRRFFPRLRNALAVLALALPLAASAYPTRPLEWIVPYPAGGGSDVVARSLVEAMSKSLGQTLVVMNKPGAATNIGADYVARAKPDGHVMFVDSATGSQNIAAGKLRAIGIASAGRVKNFEGIPTLGEQGLDGFEAHAWQGVVVPAKTPAHALAALSKALLTALESATVRARLEGLGLEVTPSTPEQMAADATAEREKWGRIIRANNIKLD